MKRAGIVVGPLAGLVVGLIVGLVGPSALPATAAARHTVKGFLSLQDASSYFGKQCRGSGGYVDLAPGTPVVVRDGAGELLATGQFGKGKGSGAKKSRGFGARAACVFRFVVKDVPDTDTYLFHVSHRGALAYTHEELEASNWRIGTVLGG